MTYCNLWAELLNGEVDEGWGALCEVGADVGVMEVEVGSGVWLTYA